MKAKYLIAILFPFLLSCKKETVEVITELPANILVLTPVENIVDSVNSIIPESGNTLQICPFLFSDTIQKNIVLAKESKVYVTYINSSTVCKNTLCWYSYNKLQPPQSNNDIKGNVVFPNISSKTGGGLLETGYTVQLRTETFPEGTVIGFFLVANGWQNGTINYVNRTYYTNYNLNTNGEQQHVLFENAYSHYLIIGFEDYYIGIKDYNDILFSVSDNNNGYESTSFDLSKVIVR